ncbi:hypothetical protein BC833DRAFT_396816 [Globomyces pollinis-pini]|nr:hypothetical protein BC833DRAFT_396816 [Globomyces pollinis-pini]
MSLTTTTILTTTEGLSTATTIPTTITSEPTTVLTTSVSSTNTAISSNSPFSFPSSCLVYLVIGVASFFILCCGCIIVFCIKGKSRKRKSLSIETGNTKSIDSPKELPMTQPITPFDLDIMELENQFKSQNDNTQKNRNSNISGKSSTEGMSMQRGTLPMPKSGLGSNGEPIGHLLPQSISVRQVTLDDVGKDAVRCATFELVDGDELTMGSLGRNVSYYGNLASQGDDLHEPEALITIDDMSDPSINGFNSTT